MTSLYDFSAMSLAGEKVDLSTYAGKVVLVVNTASKCGLTPQFEGLQSLQADYEGKGVVVLGFPCDQFAHQEPGNAEEIGSFCQRNYGVTFPMFAKVDVNGENAHPLWSWLRSQKKGLAGDAIKWNFTKFLIDPSGQVVKRFAPTTKPEAIRADIDQLLAQRDLQ